MPTETGVKGKDPGSKDGPLKDDMNKREHLKGTERDVKNKSPQIKGNRPPWERPEALGMEPTGRNGALQKGRDIYSEDGTMSLSRGDKAGTEGVPSWSLLGLQAGSGVAVQCGAEAGAAKQRTPKGKGVGRELKRGMRTFRQHVRTRVRLGTTEPFWEETT